MRILTYNTWLLPQLRWPPIALVRDHLAAEQRLRAPLIGAAIEADVDVVVLQEVFDRHARRKLFESMRFQPHRSIPLEPEVSLPFGLRAGGVVICSRFPILDQAQLVFRDSTGLDRGLTKGAVYCHLQAPDGAHAHVVGTHLQAHNGPRRQAIRRAQLRQVRNWVAAMNIPSNDVVLFVGDLNVPASEADELAQMLAILDAELPFEIPEAGATYDPAANVLCREDDREWLDYVLLHRRHRRCENSAMRLFQPTAQYGGDERERPLSDHFGVDVTFTF